MRDEHDDIERYRNGSLSESERHALEKKALNDPFLADALEGAEHIAADEFSADVKSLNEKIQQPKPQVWLSPLRIAAGIVILISAGSLLYFFNLPQTEIASEELAVKSEQAGPNATLPKDSSLLTLAKPEEPTGTSKQSATQPRAKNLALATPKADASERKSAPQVLQEEQKSEKPAVVEEVEGDKSKIKEAEISDEKVAVSEPLQTRSLSQTGAGMATKKESVSRDARAKDDVALNDVSGQVTSAETGTPLSGANVKLKGAKRGTVTDGNGNFTLRVPDQNQTLQFSSIGRRAQEVSPNNRSVLNVQLAEDNSSMSEVVVVGKSDDSLDDPNIIDATPSGGISAYRQYLETNLRYPPQALVDKIKGDVIIQFSVAPDGHLSNFNILDGIGHRCDEEVIRLIDEGPEWKPSIQAGKSIESTVRVRVKFDPNKTKR